MEANLEIIYVASAHSLRQSTATMSGVVYSLSKLTDAKANQDIRKVIDAKKESILIVYDDASMMC